METFLRLRSDETESFKRVQDELKTFLRSVTEVDDEARVIELGLHLDSELRKYEARMKTLKSRYPASLGQLALGATAIGLIAVLPEHAAKLISGFLGAAQLQDGIARLFANQEAAAEVRMSPFHVTWMLNELSRTTTR